MDTAKFSVVGTLQNPQTVKIDGRVMPIYEGVILSDGDNAFRVSYYEYLTILESGKISNPIPVCVISQEEDTNESSDSVE